MRSLVVGEVTATLEEAIDGVEGDGDGEVVEVGKGGGVDEGGEERVDGAKGAKLGDRMRRTTRARLLARLPQHYKRP